MCTGLSLISACRCIHFRRPDSPPTLFLPSFHLVALVQCYFRIRGVRAVLHIGWQPQEYIAACGSLLPDGFVSTNSLPLHHSLQSSIFSELKSVTSISFKELPCPWLPPRFSFQPSFSSHHILEPTRPLAMAWPISLQTLFLPPHLQRLLS